MQKSTQRCGALTRKGAPCRNPAAADGYCWLHRGKEDAEPLSEVDDLDLSDIEAALEETEDQPGIEDSSVDDLELELELDFDSEDEVDDLDMDLGMEIEPESKSAMDEANVEFKQTSEIDLAELEKMLSESGVVGDTEKLESEEALPPDSETEKTADTGVDLPSGLEVLDMTGSDFDFEGMSDDEPEDDDDLFGSADIGLEMESEEELGEDEEIDTLPDIELEMEDIELLEPDAPPADEILSTEDDVSVDEATLDIVSVEEDASTSAAGDTPDLSTLSESENSEEETPDEELILDISPMPEASLKGAPTEELILDIPLAPEESSSDSAADDDLDLSDLPESENPLEDAPIEELTLDIEPVLEIDDDVSGSEAAEVPDLSAIPERESLSEEMPSGEDLVLEMSDESEPEATLPDQEPGAEMDTGDLPDLEMPFDEISENSEELSLDVEPPADPEPEASVFDLDQTIRLDISDLPDFEMAIKEEAAPEAEKDGEVTEEDFSLEMETDITLDSPSEQEEEAAESPLDEVPETPEEGIPDDVRENAAAEECQMEDMADYWLDIETVKAEHRDTPEKKGSQKSAALAEETTGAAGVDRTKTAGQKDPRSELSDTWEIKPSRKVKPLKKIDPGVFAEKQNSILKRRISVALSILLAVLTFVIGGIIGGGYLLGSARSGDPGNLKMHAFATTSKIAANENLGPLFVITGQVQNSYGHDRMAVRVTGRLFIQGGFSKSATVFCGNKLSEAELSESDATFFSKRMQESQTRSVSPGGILPFVVVFQDLPDDLDQLDRYTVEVVGSKAL